MSAKKAYVTGSKYTQGNCTPFHHNPICVTYSQAGDNEINRKPQYSSNLQSVYEPIGLQRDVCLSIRVTNDGNGGNDAKGMLRSTFFPIFDRNCNLQGSNTVGQPVIKQTVKRQDDELQPKLICGNLCEA